MKIKDVCYTCGYFDPSLGVGKRYKCFTDKCPVKTLGSAKVSALLREHKKDKR